MSIFKSIFLVLLSIGSGFVVLGFCSWLRADISYSRGNALADAGYLKSAVRHLENAVSLWKWEPAYQRELASVYTRLAVVRRTSDTSERYILSAAEHAKIAYDLNPQNMITLKSLIPTFYTLSKFNAAYKKTTYHVLERALSRAPNDPNLWYLKGVVLQGYNEQDRARNAYQKSLRLRSDYVKARDALQSLE